MSSIGRWTNEHYVVRRLAGDTKMHDTCTLIVRGKRPAHRRVAVCRANFCEAARLAVAWKPDPGHDHYRSGRADGDAVATRLIIVRSSATRQSVQH